MQKNVAQIRVHKRRLIARNYSDSRFKILTTARSQFYLSLMKADFILRKKQICAGKSSLYLPFKCFDKIRACCHCIDCISLYH